jgi:hypothetical protein
MHFTKMRDIKVKQVFFECGYQWDCGGLKERVKEGEDGGYILYSYMKNRIMKTIETVL